MEAALAARATHLDRAALLRTVRGPASVPARSAARFASGPIDPPPPPADEALASLGLELAEGTFVGDGVAVPSVAGVPSRIAVRRLHALGLRVSRPLAGEILGTEPSAGTRVLPGDTIRLMVRPRTDDD